MKRRVVITGIGVVTPVGSGREEFWEALLRGRSGISPISSFDASDFPCRIAGEVRGFRAEDHMERRDALRMDRFCRMAVAAARLACLDAGLGDGPGAVAAVADPERAAVVVGSGIGGISTFEEQHSVLLQRGRSRVSPHVVPMLIPNMAAGWIAILGGWRGPNLSTVTACAAGTHALGLGFRLIASGEADICLAGGAEASITPLALAGFCSMRALSTRNDEPERASRPFDRGRDGFVMAEGSGLLVLEDMELAEERGARIYAEVAGFGMSADAYHLTAPDPAGRGASLCMREALRSAGLRPEQVDYINAHGTSTPLNDRVETLAIREVFGEHAGRLAVSSTKSMTGHLLGAAGGVEAAATALALREGMIPPTINLDDPDPHCDLDYVPGRPRRLRVRAALSNSFGFGGHNACLALRAVNGA